MATALSPGKSTAAKLPARQRAHLHLVAGHGLCILNRLMGIGGDMGADQALGLFNQLLWTAMMVAAPVLVTTLVVGVVVSVLQVATQLQETTLHFIPKMLAAALVLVAVGPWMIHRVTEFAIYTIKLIPSLS